MLQPMLIGADSQPFDSPDYIYELKLDGERCLAFLTDHTELHNKRGNLLLPKFPELAQIHKQVKKPCVLDGELMVQRNGSPDFYEVARRSIMTNRFKVELASQQYPATFVAFDILSIEERDVTSLPLLERKTLLSQNIQESDRLAVSRYIRENGTALYNLAAQQDLEGVVAKRHDSLYFCGRRTKDWIKIKNLQDDDYVVCGYIHKGNGVSSIVLGQYDTSGKMVYKGHVTLGVGGNSFELITKTARRKTAPFKSLPPGNEDAIWITPKHVCTVKFMQKTQSGSLRQPVFKALRTDKEPKECLE